MHRRAASWALVAAVALLGPISACKGACGGAGDAPAALDSAGPPPSASASAMLPSPQLAASVMSVINPEHLPVYSGPTGSIEGTIFVEGDPAPPAEGKNFAKCPEAVQTRGRLFRTGPSVDGGSARPLVGAIVGVTGYSGYVVQERREAKTVTIDACEDAPRTIDLTFGQRLEFANRTKLVLAPSLAQAPSPALMLAPPRGEPVKIYVPRPGHFTLVDRMNGDFLDADVYALLHPLHATSGVDGRYRIDGVPLGELTVFARLAAIGNENAATVDVLAGVVHKVDLTLRYTAKDAGVAPPPSSAEPRKQIY